MKLLGYNNAPDKITNFGPGNGLNQTESPVKHIFVKQDDYVMKITLYCEVSKENDYQFILTKATTRELVHNPQYKFASAKDWDLDVETGILTDSEGNTVELFSYGIHHGHMPLMNTSPEVFKRNRDLNSNSEQLFELIGFTEREDSWGEREDEVIEVYTTMWFRNGEKIYSETIIAKTESCSSGYQMGTDIYFESNCNVKELPKMGWVPSQEGMMVSLVVENGRPTMYGTDVLVVFDKEGNLLGNVWEYNESDDCYYPNACSYVDYTWLKGNN